MGEKGPSKEMEGRAFHRCYFSFLINSSKYMTGKVPSKEMEGRAFYRCYFPFLINRS
jgi:ssDNA-specific exonuclease RecJ